MATEDEDVHLSYAAIFVEEGLFLPKCKGGFCVRWQEIQGAHLDFRHDGMIHVLFAGDLAIALNAEDWTVSRKSRGLPGRAKSIAELYNSLAARHDEEDEENDGDVDLSEEEDEEEDDATLDDLSVEELDEVVSGYSRSDFVNAAIDDLHTAAVLISVFKEDPRIIIDPSDTFEGFQFVLSIADPSTILPFAHALDDSVRDSEHGRRLLRIITRDTHTYAGRLKHLTDVFGELNTPENLPKKAAQTKLTKLIKRVNAAVEEFFTLVDPLYDEEAAVAEDED